ncbi:OB-fold putative lipoprotein [Flavobacterium sp. LS1R49]|uniref:OB-fold putative lipoprotein n=1 Tax=Flavobacterium shii TaxID=2987687 RepID=A0A9X2ZEH9_9FLAO|nr:OB-fold putative lipoprotein [Flavobacterium shii]MCV9927885.1 OB-fold putative lipoprotein [Flavobacterium shii]
MKKNKIVLIVLVLVLMCGGTYVYYKHLIRPSRNIVSEEPVFKISAAKLSQEYNANSQKADSRYLNKTIEINGVVTKVTDSVMMVDESVFCLFGNKLKRDLIKNKIVLKGKCIGYDELFQEVKLDQCTIN